MLIYHAGVFGGIGTLCGLSGHWGVKQTSERILSFATALTGGNPDKIEEMRAAFEKGYKKAEETWGGKMFFLFKSDYSTVVIKMQI